MTATTLDTLTAGVQSVFAEVTRYPIDILEPEADLEEDLGIDSVKLGEVFSVLRERYALPDSLEIPPDHVKNIGLIAAALHAHQQESGTPEGTLPSDPPAEVPAAAVMPPPLPKPMEAPVYSGDGTAPHIPRTAPVLHPTFAAAPATEKPLAGKVAFVSGSGRGLGKGIAMHLAELGASLIVNSFHSREAGLETTAEIKAQGGDAMHVWGSVANPAHVQTLFDEIEARHGGVDFFISNASNGMLARLENLTVEHWQKAFMTNVVGLHQCALRAVAGMKKRGGGKIITLSSPAAHGYVDYFGCMGAVKAAVESLTRSMAVEFAPYNVQVNCVSPGPVYGELLTKWPEGKRLVAQWEANTAYERFCEPEDVAHFIAYLLRDEVKLFTGSVLVIDGGISSQGW